MPCTDPAQTPLITPTRRRTWERCPRHAIILRSAQLVGACVQAVGGYSTVLLHWESIDASHPCLNADWDRAIWEYKAPHLKCACDQQGDNEDKTFMSLQHAIELYDAGRWMAILSMASTSVGVGAAAVLYL